MVVYTIQPGSKGQRKVQCRYISELQYADDAVMLGYSAEETQRMVDVFVETYVSLGMEVNNTKTKLLIIRYNAPSTPNPTISIGGNNIEVVKQFNYLGSLVTNSYNLDSEINQKIKSAESSVFKLKCRVLNSRDLRNETKVSFIKL